MITKEEAVAKIITACSNRIDRIQRQIAALPKLYTPYTYMVQIGTLYVRQVGEEILLVGPEDATRYTDRKVAAERASLVRNGNGELGAVIETINALTFELVLVEEALAEVQALA